MQKAARSFDQNVLSKLKVLPEYKKEEVLDFLDFLVDKTKHNVKSSARAVKQKTKFKFDWEGGLAEIQNKYSSVELQHKAMDWR